MTGVGFEVLDRAIAGKQPVTLAGEMDGQAVEIAGKFIAEGSEQPGIWVQPAASDGKLFDRLVAEKTPLSGVFFDNGTRVMFDTVVELFNKHYWLNERVVFEALLIQSPEDLSTTEFRAARRYRISDSVGGVYGKLFRREGQQTKELQASLWDLSLGGASFVCPLDKTFQSARSGEIFVAVIHFRGKKIMLPARLAHTRNLSSRTLRVGFRFDLSNPATATTREELLQACLALEKEGK